GGLAVGVEPRGWAPAGLVGAGTWGGRVGGEPPPVTVDREHPARKPDPVGLQGSQVEPPVIGPADQLGGWLLPREQAVGHLVDRDVEEAEAVGPPVDAHSSAAARRDAWAAHR